MTNAQSWEQLFKNHSLLPVPPKERVKADDGPPQIQTWVRVYPAKAPVKKGKRP